MTEVAEAMETAEEAMGALRPQPMQPMQQQLMRQQFPTAQCGARRVEISTPLRRQGKREPPNLRSEQSAPRLAVRVPLDQRARARKGQDMLDQTAARPLIHK